MSDAKAGKQTPVWRTAFEVGSTLVMVALAAAIVWEGRIRLTGRGSPLPPPTIPAEPISIADAPVLGVLSAPVAIIEYADFECGFCARFAQQIAPVLRRDYVDKGRVIFVSKNFPLQIHRQAAAGAEAAWCAGRQGKYWEMHDRLLGVSGQSPRLDLRRAAKEIGLDLALYDSCRARGEARQHVQAEMAEGARLQVSGTPVFFFGRVGSDRRVTVSDVLVGVRSIEEFKGILNRLLGAL